MRPATTLALLAGIVALALVGGCYRPAPKPAPPGGAGLPPGTTAATADDLSGKTVLMVIAPKDFRDEELVDVRDALESAGAVVKVASTTVAECKGMYGATVTPDILLTDVEATDYDAVVFVGGLGAEVLFDDAQAVLLAKKADGANRVVAAICIAPVILANAGVLDGKMATVWPGGRERKALEDGGAIFTGDPATQDTNVVTGDGPQAIPEFCGLLIRTIASQ